MRHYSYTVYGDKDIGEQFDREKTGNRTSRMFLDSQLSWIKKSIGKDKKILDLGAGTGRITIPLLRQGHSVEAVDASVEMLKVAKKKAKRAGLKARFLRADAHHLDYTDRKFDVAISIRTLMHFMDWKIALREMCRVSDEVIIDFPPSMGFPFIGAIWRRIRRIYDRKCEPYRVFRYKTVKKELERNGYSIKGIQRQYVLPLCLHKSINKPKISRKIEQFLKRISLTKIMGAPVTIHARRKKQDLREKKILMIGPAPYLIERGKSLRMHAHLQSLSDTGAQIDMLTYPDGKEVRVKNVRIIRASKLFQKKDPSVPGIDIKDLLSNIQMIFKTIRLLSRRYDFIHAHDVDGMMISLIAKFLRGSKTPIIYDMHGAFRELSEYYHVILGRKNVRRIEKVMYDRSAYIIMNWPHLRRMIGSDTPKRLIMDRPDAKTYSLLTGPTKKKRPFRFKYVLYTGNSAPYQRVDLVNKALRYLPEDIHLVFAGKISKKYTIKDKRVHYVGFVKDERLVNLMKHASVLISTRVTEGFPPMKLLFYLLTDVPIVATDVSCHSSLMSKEDGVLCKANPESVGKAILKAIGMNVKRDPAWKEELDPKNLREQLEEIYREVEVKR